MRGILFLLIIYIVGAILTGLVIWIISPFYNFQKHRYSETDIKTIVKLWFILLPLMLIKSIRDAFWKFFFKGVFEDKKETGSSNTFKKL